MNEFHSNEFISDELESNELFSHEFTSSEVRNDNPSSAYLHQELSNLSDFLALRLCRHLLTFALFLLIPLTAVGRMQLPKAFPTILCYLLLYLVFSEGALRLSREKKDTQKPFFPSLCVKYRYRADRLLAERLSYGSALCLLAMLQYAYRKNLSGVPALLQDAPVFLMFLILVLRYIGRKIVRNRLNHNLYSCK